MRYAFDPFASIAVKEKATNGLTTEDIGRTAFTVAATLQKLGKTWQAVDDACKDTWKGVATLAIRTVDLPENSGDVTIKVADFAKGLYQQFIAEMYAPPWDELGAADRIIWEAIARHMANLIDADQGAIDIPDLEERIIAWAKEKMLPHQLILS